MLHCHSHNLITSSLPLHPRNHSLSSLHSFTSKPSGFCSVSAHPRPRPVSWIAQVTEPNISTIVAVDGPVELPPSLPSVFATTDDPTPLQVATSVLLTGAISIFLFRSLRRRAQRAKELKFRSTGANKSLMEEALESLKAMQTTSIESDAPPSPLQTLLGGVSAGVIALILYKFTITVEAYLNRQALSDNFSVRQITITIRTIVNGLCYLATFVFGVNSVGLLLYSVQLSFNSLMSDSSAEKIESKGEGDLASLSNVTKNTITTTKSDESKETQSDAQ